MRISNPPLSPFRKGGFYYFIHPTQVNTPLFFKEGEGRLLKNILA